MLGRSGPSRHGRKMGGAHFDPRRHHPVPTAWEAAGTGGGPSVGRIPDDGEGVLIILPGGPAQIGIEPAGSEFRRRSEEHTSELQSLMRISYAVFFLKKKHK